MSLVMAGLLLIPLASALVLTVNAQTARFVGDSLVIADGKQRIRLTEVPGADSIARCVHAVQKRDGEYFVLIGAREWSRGYPPRGGYCGAGEEAYVEWLRVRDGKIAERTMALFGSCLDNRDGSVSGWRGSVLTVETSDLVEDRNAPANRPAVWREITFTFDASRPAEGIKQKEIKRENR